MAVKHLRQPPKASKKSRAQQAQCDTAREAFLSSARRLFADRGFEGASVKELAKAAGHNPAMINYYFGGKEGLYRECVRPLVNREREYFELALRCPSGLQDFVTRFSLFLEEYCLSHLAQAEICRILRQDCHTDVVKKLYQEHFLSAYDHLHAFLKSAKRGKLLRSDLDAGLAAQLVFGSVYDLIGSDRIRESVGVRQFLDAKSTPATLRQLTQFLLHGMLAPK